MSAPILERLNHRIAAEPSLDNIETLFTDLQDAHDAIVTAAEENLDLKNRLAAEPAAATSSDTVAEAIDFLKHAQERLSVNALSTVGDHIARAISLLGG